MTTEEGYRGMDRWRGTTEGKKGEKFGDRGLSSRVIGALIRTGGGTRGGGAEKTGSRGLGSLE